MLAHTGKTMHCLPPNYLPPANSADNALIRVCLSVCRFVLLTFENLHLVTSFFGIVP